MGVLGELQDIRDILRYVSHSDPQLKGNTAIVIGHLLRAVLTEGRGSFDKWVQSSGLTKGQDTQLQLKTYFDYYISTSELCRSLINVYRLYESLVIISTIQY